MLTRGGTGSSGGRDPLEVWEHIVDEINRIPRMTFTYVAQFDLSRLSKDRRIQCREDVHVAPKEMVSKFQVQMGQSVFPPIIVTKDDWTVDGNTRIEAKHQRREGFHSAFIIGIEYATATDQQKRNLRILAATLNANSGLSLTRAERRLRAIDMIQENWFPEQIARALGISGSMVSQVKREMNVKERCDRLGIWNQIDGHMAITNIRSLGYPDPLALNNQPYRELCELARDAGLRVGEIGELAKEMRRSGADDKALEIVRNKRHELDQRIREHALTGNGGHTSSSAMLRQALGRLVPFVGREQSLVEQDPSAIERHLEMINVSLKVLQRTKQLQTA